MNGQRNLSELFNGAFYRIPDYQRGYAWGQRQLEDFWEDLESSKDSKHYTGVLSIERVSDEEKKKSQWVADKQASKKKAFYVVDGQQRLTTSIILLQVLLESVQGEKWFIGLELADLRKKYIGGKTEDGLKYYFFGYMQDNPSFEFLKTQIFGDDSSSNTDTKSIYTQNLKKAKEFFTNKIKESTKEYKEGLFHTLTENFVFNVYEIANDFDVFVAFETMNNRGKPLSTLELLKNRLIYLSTKIDNAEQLREDINNYWGRIYEALGRNPKYPLKDDSFLQQHWIMYFTYNRKGGNPYKEFLLNEKFTLKNLLRDESQLENSVAEKCDKEEIEKYIKSLGESVKHYYFIHTRDSKDENEEIKYWLEKLSRLGFGSFEPLIMALLCKRQEREISNEELVEVLKEIERCRFLVFETCRYHSTLENTTIYGLARDVYHTEIATKDIIDSVREVSYNFSFEKFYNHINDNFKSGEGFYAWNGLRYFLFEYEIELQHKTKGNTPKMTWENFIKPNSKDYETIEHILPQDNTQWQNVLNNTIGIKGRHRSKTTRGENIKRLTHALGNLVPLSRAKNTKLLNHPFDKKKELFADGSYSEIEISKESQWGREEIEKRTQKLLDFLIERWGIDEILEYWKEQEWIKDAKEHRQKYLEKLSFKFLKRFRPESFRF